MECGARAEYGECSLTAEVYDQVYAAGSAKAVAFYRDTACSTPGPVLELGCGTGRILREIARAGLEVVGVDISASMLAASRAMRSQPDGVVASRIRLIQADMRDFELGMRFGLVIIPFHTFQHMITVWDQVACLDRVRRHLTSDGLLAFDVYNPSIPHLAEADYQSERADAGEVLLADGRRVQARSRIAWRDYFAQTQQVELIYYVTHCDGRQERVVHSFPMRYLFRYEVEHLLARCGFDVLAVYGDYDRSPYGKEYPGELVVVARRSQVAKPVCSSLADDTRPG